MNTDVTTASIVSSLFPYFSPEIMTLGHPVFFVSASLLS
jgi:hypothetical protein